MTDWDARWIGEARERATWSTCLRRQVGAVLVSAHSKRRAGEGYNGSAQNTPHCSEVGCVRERDNTPRGVAQQIHAALMEVEPELFGGLDG